MKRLLDILISCFLLLILFPILLLVGTLLKLKMGSPILFKQQRPGIYGRPFYVYKFRTMTQQTNNKGELLPDHLRLTTLGKFIRKFSIDEIPQLVNVIKGEMSLVGPRPLLMEYLQLYTKEQALRHQVRPGITGWAQINGRNSISWDERLELDIWYVKHQSVFLDLKILAITCLKVVKKEGIHYQGHATMEKFKGSKEGIQ